MAKKLFQHSEEIDKEFGNVYKNLVGHTVETTKLINSSVSNLTQLISGETSKNVLYVSATATKYKTIAHAVGDWATSKIVLLAPETFTEDVIISEDFTLLVGMQQEGSIIDGSLTISGKDVIVENLTISGDLIITCTDTWDWFKWITIRNCTIKGNIYFGTASTRLKYQALLFNCRINPSEDYIPAAHTIYVYGDSTHLGRDKIINSISYAASDIVLNNGKLQYANCEKIVIGTITYEGSSGDSWFGFTNCEVQLTGAITNNKISPDYAILVFRWSRIVRDSSLTSLTFTNLFELDVMTCEWQMPDLVFDSTANSRLTRVIQLGYGSTSTISGTGLANLYCQDSDFACAAPAGLGENSSRWNIFIDN